MKVPVALRFVFNRTKWQSDENYKAKKADPSVEPDGVEFHKIAIHFPQGFLRFTLLEREFIRLQHVHGTRGMKRLGDKTMLVKSRPEKPVLVYGYPVSGTNAHDIFQQLATLGLDLIDNEENEAEKQRLIDMVTLAKPLPRFDKKVKREKGEKPRLETQIPLKVNKELFERVCEFQEEHKIKNRANIFYYLCLLALESFKDKK